MMSHNVYYPTSGTEHIVYCWYDSSDGISRYGMRMNDGGPWSAWDISNFHSGTMYYELTGTYMTS